MHNDIDAGSCAEILIILAKGVPARGSRESLAPCPRVKDRNHAIRVAPMALLSP